MSSKSYMDSICIAFDNIKNQNVNILKHNWSRKTSYFHSYPGLYKTKRFVLHCLILWGVSVHLFSVLLTSKTGVVRGRVSFWMEAGHNWELFSPGAGWDRMISCRWNGMGLKLHSCVTLELAPLNSLSDSYRRGLEYCHVWWYNGTRWTQHARNPRQHLLHHPVCLRKLYPLHLPACIFPSNPIHVLFFNCKMIQSFF